MPEQTQTDQLVFEKKHLLAEYKDDILKALEALVKVAKRVGVPAPTWTIGETYDFEFQVILGSSGYGEDYEEEWETYIEPVFDITINLSECIKMAGGWKLIAAINHRADTITQIDEDFELPARFTSKTETCEHCNVKMPRVMSYVIYSEADGFKQVGKSCLKQFLGINPASYISMFEAISKFSPIIEAMGYRKNAGGRLDNLAYKVEDIFKLTYRVVETEGQFVKNEWKKIQTGSYYYNGDEKMKSVRSNMGESTMDKVNDRLFILNTYKKHPNELEFAKSKNKSVGLKYAQEDVDAAEVQVSIKTELHLVLASSESETELEQARELLGTAKYTLEAIRKYKLYFDTITINDDYKSVYELVRQWANELTATTAADNSMSSFDEFKMGVKDVMGKMRTLQSRAKYIVSGYNMYLNHVTKEAERTARLEKAKFLEYVGVVGEKSKLTLTVTGYKTGEGSFGRWELWNMADADGNLFSKFGKLNEKYITGDLDIVMFPEAYKLLSEAERAEKQPKITATFEIKGHNEYQEQKITELGRISKP